MRSGSWHSYASRTTQKRSSHARREIESQSGNDLRLVGKTENLIHPEEIVAVYDVVRDAPMSFFRLARVVRKGGKLDIVAD